MPSVMQKKTGTGLQFSNEAKRSRTRAEDKLRAIITALQHDIVFGELKPRERLVEEDLSERFEVGRHVIRAAIEELDRLGLVRRRANKGAIVSDLTPEEVDELYEVRFILQREAASRIPLPAPPELIAELTAINKRFEVHAKAGELDQASAANDQFHRALYDACGNRFLAQLIQEYWVKTGSIHSYAIGKRDLVRKSCDEHRAMVAALANNDRKAFMRLAVEHMLPALEAFKSAHGGWHGHKDKLARL